MFRPIAVMSPFLSKVFENTAHILIFGQIEWHALLNKFHSRFKRQHSCTLAILKATDNVRLSFDGDDDAFDTINHLKLVKKILTHFN